MGEIDYINVHARQNSIYTLILFVVSRFKEMNLCVMPNDFLKIKPQNTNTSYIFVTHFHFSFVTYYHTPFLSCRVIRDLIRVCFSGWR